MSSLSALSKLSSSESASREETWSSEPARAEETTMETLVNHSFSTSQTSRSERTSQLAPDE